MTKTTNNELWMFNERDMFTTVEPRGDSICPRSSCKSCVGPNESVIYYYGGYSNRKDNCFDDLYSYDTKTNVMKKIPLTGSPSPKRSDHSLVKFKNFLYIFGGCDGAVKYNDLFRINLQEQQVSFP